jgi:c(7)-type cytochrome triheme protein
MFWLEMGMGVLLPMVLFAIPAVRRSSQARFVAALMTVLGFVVNRLNVSLTGMLGASGARYFPSWMELAVTAAMVALGFAGFALAVKYLAVFEHGPAPARPPVPASAPRLATLNGRGLLALWGMVGVGAALVLLAGRSTAAPASPPARPAAAAVQLAAAPPELKLPDTFSFPKGEGSPGEVSFCHESHQSRLAASPRACATCHATGFSLRRSGKALAGAVTMERMQKGELCGACHDGKQAFALDDCAGCHQ